MASAGFVRYTGYDNADILKNMLIEAYAAAKKNGLFFEGRSPWLPLRRSVLPRTTPRGISATLSR